MWCGSLFRLSLGRPASVCLLSVVSGRSYLSTMSLSKRKVCVVGSGNWGSAIAKIIGNNAVEKNDLFERRVTMWVYEEMINGRKLTEIINTEHQNVKYLPDIILPDNVVAIPDVKEAAEGADILVFVLPHQFVSGVCKQLKGTVKPGAIAVTLIKGFEVAEGGGIYLISDVIRKNLHIPCSILMGANIANEVALENYCEATIGCKDPEMGKILKSCFESSYFRIVVVEDEHTVEVCGALKNIVAVGAGFADGLGFGDNTKAAVIRLGLMEMVKFCEVFYPGSQQSTFLESCGVADLVTTCYGGRNRRVAEAFVKTGKPIEQLEEEMLNGQKLQGPPTAFEVNYMLRSKNMEERFPLFTAIHRICNGEIPVKTFLDCLRNHPEHIKIKMSIEQRFTQNLTDHFKENKKGLIPKSDYQKTIDDLKAAAANPKAKGRLGYYLLQKYEVLQCGPTEKLIKKRSTPQELPLYYVSIEETFDVIKSVHISTGHGGRDRMLKELQKKYANIPTKAVELFKSLCQECQKKRKQPMTKGVVVRPILTNEFSSRGQVDLIDMQSMPSGSNKKWIMVYQDHLTKFCVLRALMSKRAAEVAFHLLEIFLLIGAPVILQSDNGSEFTSQVITELKEIWPKLTLVHGKPRHPQSQGSVERANGDIKDMLVAWLADNNTQDWPTGIKFVQFQKNSTLHSGIKCSPYSAMFGCEARVGLTTSSLPEEVIALINTEEDLLAVAPIRPTTDSDNDNALSQNNGVANQIQAASDETPAVTAEILYLSTGPFSPTPTPAVTAENLDLPTRPSSPTPTASANDADSPVSSAENHRVAEHIQEIKRRRCKAVDAQTSQAERMVKRSRIDLRAGEKGDNVAVPVSTC